MKPIGEFVLMYEDAETTTLKAFEVEERDGVRFVLTTSGTSVGLTVQRETALRWAHALLDLLEAPETKSKRVAEERTTLEDCFTPPRYPGEIWVSDMGRAYIIRAVAAGVYRAADFETGAELSFSLRAVGESFWRTLMEGGLKFSCPRCEKHPEVYDSPHGPIESCPRCQPTPPFPRRAR